MAKQEQQPASVAEVWKTIEKYCNLPPVTGIKDHAEQLAEIDSRLAALTADLARIGAAVTPTAIAAALSINKDTYNRYVQALAAEKDEKGNVINVSLEKSGKNEEEKRYILQRCETIKKYLQQGEFLTLTLAQSRDNRENGGSLWIAENVYSYGQQQGKEQVTFTLEDMLQTYAAIKERQAKADKT